ncbi:MAG: hypothetical protein HY074_12020, partial [Deltaproteobacteria bacterium]|nr:hypothetical protein [Deltaproteobacteria bacterium]
RVAPGGYLAISCPNQRWRWLLSLAQCLHVRKNYKGYENWVRPSDLHEWVKGAGLEVVRAEGIHFLPWQLLPKSIIRRLDRLTRGWNYGWAINLALLARRP